MNNDMPSISNQSVQQRIKEVQSSWNILSERIEAVKRDLALALDGQRKVVLQLGLDNLEKERNELEQELKCLETGTQGAGNPPKAESIEVIATTQSWFSKLRSEFDLPADAPFYEYLGHAAVYAFAQIQEEMIALVLQFVVLGIFSVVWAWGISNPGLDLQPWMMGGVIWAGLTGLPLITGSLPLKQERRILAKADLTKSQRMALWLEKVFGIYITAFLPEMATTMIWLLLIYSGWWSTWTVVYRIAFWAIMALASSAFAIIGSVIAIRYIGNLHNSGQTPSLDGQTLLLGFAFPLVLYPGFLFFVWSTASIWSQWQLACPLTGAGLVLLIVLLRKSTSRNK
jgi:hypothetical protein